VEHFCDLSFQLMKYGTNQHLTCCVYIFVQYNTIMFSRLLRNQLQNDHECNLIYNIYLFLSEHENDGENDENDGAAYNVCLYAPFIYPMVLTWCT
jgi:hypothetical protein